MCWWDRAIYRGESARDVSNGAAGVAYGFTPGPRVTVWTQVDARLRDETNGESVVFVNETSFEALRGLWLKFSPQVRTEAGTVPGFLRYKLEANILPRTHWNVDIAYYRDQNRRNKFVTPYGDEPAASVPVILETATPGVIFASCARK